MLFPRVSVSGRAGAGGAGEAPGTLVGMNVAVERPPSLAARTHPRGADFCRFRKEVPRGVAGGAWVRGCHSR